MNIYTSEVEYLRDKVKQLEEALAKQEQGEPVAWFRYEDGMWIYYETKAWDDLQPLYTTPQQRTWVGLTKQEIRAILESNDWTTIPARLIWEAEAKLKEKNT
jgi:hypothetical protein